MLFHSSDCVLRVINLVLSPSKGWLDFLTGVRLVLLFLYSRHSQARTTVDSHTKFHWDRHIFLLLNPPGPTES